MCTLALIYRRHPRWPVICLANRDEYRLRPSLAPHLWENPSGEPLLWAGKDLTGGGTWLGVNSHGLLAGVTNRFNPAGPRADALSRGHLPIEALKERSAEAAATRLRALPLERFNRFNLLIADAQRAFVLTNHPAVEIRPVAAPGVLLGNDSAFEGGGTKRELFFRMVAEGFPSSSPDVSREEALAVADRFLTRHEGIFVPEEQCLSDLPICIHGEAYGTVSSALWLISQPGGDSFGYWTDGPKCEKAWQGANLFGGDGQGRRITG